MVPDRGRYPELDAFRGLAVSMMIFFHFFVDLSFLGVEGPDPFSGPLRIIGLLTASLFIFIAGISAHIKAEKTTGTKKQAISFLYRGGELILIGIGITAVTWIYLGGQGYVVFGILSLIGTALVLTPLFYKAGNYSLLVAAIISIVAFFVPLPHGPLWMAPGGIHPENFFSIDYTPLIPWLAVFLTGLSAGRIIYPKGEQRWIIGKIPRFFFPFTVIGKRSLLIYLVHQPVMILLISSLTGTGI
ncbi:MAG: DUF1624 domain-containing protein [Methanospirillum sp.]|nr:DUF1624 domain-containing protein [Methanospirillum sp.]